MVWVARVTGTLVFLFSILLGVSAMFNPERAAENLGFAPLSDMGRNSMRADIVSLAWSSAIVCAIGLFKGRGRWFLGAAVIFGIAVSGRIIDVLVSGAPAGVVPAIAVEFTVVFLALISARWLPHTK